MPHIIVEYCEDLFSPATANELLRELNISLGRHASFKTDDIKARAYPLRSFLAGTSDERRFVHLTVRLMPGRSLEIKQTALASLVQQVRQFVEECTRCSQCEISAEMVELEKETYVKHRCA